MAHHLRRDPGELVQKKRKQDKHDNFDRLKGEMEMFRNQLISVLLTVFLLISLPACAAMSETAEGTDYDEVFVIVHTNDVHGFIDVEPYVKAVADDMKAQYGENNVVTVSAGDVFSGGNAVAHLYNGETIPPIMEAAGYDILAPGNNDLFLGRDQLLVLAGMFDHTKVLCANLFEQALDENGEPVLDEDGNILAGNTAFDRTMIVRTPGGTKIGLFGLTVSGKLVIDDFVPLGTIDAAQEAVNILKTEGCGVVIGVGHTGWNDDLVTPSANDVTSAQLVKEVSGIDAYIDGHSHSIIGGGSGWVCPETGTLVNQASCKGACVGVIKLYIKDGAVVAKQAELLTDEYLKAHYTPDPSVKALVDAAWERLAGDAGEMYLESPYFLNAYRASESVDKRSVRTDETNLGDLVADFMRSYTEADVAFAPGVMIRCSIDKGKIYTLNLYDVFAIGCDLYVTEMTGEELLSRMASSLADLPFESPVFSQISGASYGYLKEYTLSAEGEKVYTIINPTVNGEPLAPDQIYRVAYCFVRNESGALKPVISTMEEAAAAMGEYLKSGEAVILPDVPVPDHRIVPMEEIPAGAVIYEVEPETENEKAA
ncbi:MAG: 5'-nucleotidase C-terminal domain-containing protein [Clostridia bacterium]|nr:5'-nucleotidase C-terminal domain-containing protein [Clostridia bacterium]